MENITKDKITSPRRPSDDGYPGESFTKDQIKSPVPRRPENQSFVSPAEVWFNSHPHIMKFQQLSGVPPKKIQKRLEQISLEQRIRPI
ncbi:hypothetical protein CEXT_217391 [Caerostris extrusa]|uniref:Uncharacterized protein n=1 Tax=Caerostris extrusa TaxID=172846 RepID=A0AAV4SH42_CAEEX|nr:hypothetical protein CEXT_217391 [Caerostris extrusa]